MIRTPRDKFIELMSENVKANGLDETTSKLAAVLFLEAEEISLEELAKKSGYSLSSTSTSIKFMETTGLIHKYKRPHSKKIYLKMENDIIEVMLNMLKKKQEYIIRRSKSDLPHIISEYKKTKSSRQELNIIEKYYNDVLIGEQIIGDMIKRMEKARKI
ncbi:TPA: MarR family transcriptional regulator [Candidatus Woesearchaeota archaeon]|nr:MarR family transcriptional regulator [Candidatus Woesearchaeota archaeon]HIH31776.1 MarR family transcriptional regulator [Candidatus Woesearchaeota archaeon]HIH54663.1 MarR family transcriptional regulator [Candidatus Woesearchaeota archaeon]HIJ01550.1 MarR family transcriptional regulator [Candidatus Woesearchaeota archaeon]HIJ13953.1 MarR family transcriptional regulator [Candidatus Woesearchaeota archaeon]